ncbi:MAG: hypothetical protein BMS9Abin28_2150 [Anaerolineae bacterium]|nr:MAG: hypothetical protein BMS9Abin28_2150 [Anaerolineae bacterium]
MRILPQLCAAFLLTPVVVMLGITSFPAYANTSHCGTIGTDETWSSDANVHILTCDVTVASGVTLTIAEGTIVKFDRGKSLIVDGSLKILGTSGNPVYLTSYRDDTIGGNTDGDGASTGLPGDWKRIEFRADSDDATSLIDYAVIRFGGEIFGTDRGVITLLDASPTIQNTTITASEYCAIRANLGSFPTLSNNTLTDNDANGLCLDSEDGNSTIASDASWDVTDTSYYLRDSITVAFGATLTVDPDVVIKIAAGKSLFVEGALRILGTGADPVYITSYRDDTIGKPGDTNGGGASTGLRGDWKRIEFTADSDDAASLIDHAVIRFGGETFGTDRGAITLLDASPTIQNTTITESEYCAIRANLGSFPTLNNTTLTDNDANGLCLDNEDGNSTIGSDATWDVTDTSYYVRDTLTVAFGATLTVDPDVVIKMAFGQSLFVEGALRTLGTGPDPVYITSYRDDTIGKPGDTNGGGASTGLPGDWERIEFAADSDDAASLIDHAVIRFGGEKHGTDRGAITLLDASPTIQNSTITESEYCAIRANLGSFPTLSNNTLTDNDANGLCLDNEDGNSTIGGSATWGVTDTSYYVRDTFTVAFGATLTVDPDVVIKMGAGQSLFVEGALRVLGTGADPVYITSYRDDTIGGDTNGGGASTGSQGDWKRIEFTADSDDAASLIDHAVIRFGGEVHGTDYGAVTIVSASPTIQNSVITQNEFSGILTQLATPNLGCNDIHSNQTYGLFNQTPETLVAAEGQWWGSPTGPFHPDTNPDGPGNAVSDGVNYVPWRSFTCGSDLFRIFLPIIIRE